MKNSFAGDDRYIQFMKVKMKEDELSFVADAANEKYLVKFFRFVLEKKCGLTERDSAMVGTFLGGVLYESGEDEAVSKYPPSERMKNVLYTYAIEFEPWLEWANMEIHPKSFENVPDKSELAAHILWEMTFCGFSEKAVENQKNKLIDIVKDFESKMPEKNKGSEFNFGELSEDEDED